MQVMPQNSQSLIKVRFAPSPTGVPHIGGIRSALYNYLFAKHTGGKFLLRIEDTDRKRFVEEAEDAIINSLKWLGLDWDEEITHQSERLEIYKKHVQILLDKKIAYEKDDAIWVKMPEDKIFTWVDLVGNKNISFEGKDQKDFVVLKSDGFPTYHLANVIDDHLMGITHVIRGEEWISSVPKHLYLYESFAWDHPEFAHMPVILGPDKGKLSKRHGAKSVLDYKNDGFLKEAILNFIAILGWNPGGDKEILSLEEMINNFDIKDINISNPKFDLVKLEWMNGVYIRNLSLKDLKARAIDYGVNLTKYPSKELDGLLDLAKTRITNLSELSELISPFFNPEKKKLKSEEEEIRNILKGKFLSLDSWQEEKILDILREVVKAKNKKMSIVYKIMIGTERGLPLPQALSIIGKERALNLLNE
jgi:glutamyl-tRNA synthetase